MSYYIDIHSYSYGSIPLPNDQLIANLTLGSGYSHLNPLAPPCTGLAAIALAIAIAMHAAKQSKATHLSGLLGSFDTLVNEGN